MTMRPGADPIRIVRRRRPAAAGQPAAYRFAGGKLVTDSPLQYLAPWRLAAVQDPTCVESASNEPDAESGEHISLRGWIAGENRRVEVLWQGDSADVEIERIANFRLQFTNGSITCEERSTDARVIEEALFGPPVVLHLARRDTWCLHASAVSIPGNDDVVLLCGESGVGKSTLARWLASSTPPWPRIADDIVPVCLRSGMLVALPHFPQFKCAPDETYPKDAHRERRVCAVVEIGRGDEDLPVAWHATTGHQSGLTLARHTVAARLFDRRLLARHLDFVRRAAPLATVSRLEYPSGRPALRAVTSALRARVR